MADDLDLQPAQPQYQRIAATVRARIAAGDLRPGERLPAIRALATELGVGRHTVEEAAADLFPVGELQRALNATLREEGADALGYEAPEGYAPLRAALARHLLGLGLAASPGEVLVTSGAQQAVDLTLRALTKPGDYVVTESPTYLGILDACEANGVRLIGVPLDEEGMDVDHLAPLLAEYRPRLLL